MAIIDNRPKKPKFVSGAVCFSLVDEERLFMLSLVKKAKPKGELEKRALQRLVLRCMGQPVSQFPLHSNKICPICKHKIVGKMFKHHSMVCKAKKEMEKRVPKIDSEVYALLNEMSRMERR